MNLRQKMDLHMIEKYGAIYKDHLGGSLSGQVFFYQSAHQRLLVEVADGKFTVYSFAEGG